MDYQIIKSDLPNFPDEVIKDFLLPLAADYGEWPKNWFYPGKWIYVLGEYPLEDLQKVTWEFVEVDMSKLGLTQPYESMQAHIRDGLTKAIPFGTQNGADRITSILRYLEEHGTLPKPLVLKRANKGLDVMDGNHRIAAWRIFNERMVAAENDSRNFMQDAWIATYPEQQWY